MGFGDLSHCRCLAHNTRDVLGPKAVVGCKVVSEPRIGEQWQICGVHARTQIEISGLSKFGEEVVGKDGSIDRMLCLRLLPIRSSYASSSHPRIVTWNGARQSITRTVAGSHYTRC